MEGVKSQQYKVTVGRRYLSQQAQVARRGQNREKGRNDEVGNLNPEEWVANVAREEK